MNKIKRNHKKASESQVTFKDYDFSDNHKFFSSSKLNNHLPKPPIKKNNPQYFTYQKEKEEEHKNLYTQFLDGKKITFNKIPMKTFEEIEVICEEETSISEQPFHQFSEPLMISIEDSIFFNKKLFTKMNFFYYSFYEYFLNEEFIFDEEKIDVANKQIENFLNNNLSAFNLGNNKTLEDTFPRMKTYELMTLGLLEFYFQLHLNLYFPFCDEMSVSDVGDIYTCLGEIFYSIYEIVLLIFLINKGCGNSIKKFLGEKENIQGQNLGQNQGQNLGQNQGQISPQNLSQNSSSEFDDSHYEKLCLNYLEDFYKGGIKPTKEQIPTRVNDLINLISNHLLHISEIITNYYTQIFDVLKNIYDNDFLEEIAFIEKLTSILKDEKIMPLEKRISFYTEYSQILTEYIPILNKIYLKLLEENRVKAPFLPKKEDNKITLVLDLDETLVHYMEEGETAYVQVRPGAENFLINMKNYFEIVVFTAASKEYAEIVLKELDKEKTISAILYRKHTLQRAGVFLKDLSKLGRDLKKIIIVDNARVNFSLQSENGLEILPFVGDQNDQELLFLGNDLIELNNMNLKDIRDGLDIIRERMIIRYKK